MRLLPKSPIRWYKRNMSKSNVDFIHVGGVVPTSDVMELSSMPRDTDGITIGKLARDSGVTLRALRFYQSKGLLTPRRQGASRVFSSADCARLALIQQGKRLGFTLFEIRDMLAARSSDGAPKLPISRKKCVEQIKHLEHQRRDLELALTELRQIYTGMFVAAPAAADPVAKTG
jgi:DNA-binding transcriptional MerR regulator